MKFREVVTIAQSLDDHKDRTDDVLTDLSASFESLLLSEAVRKGLKRTGFRRPSPVQLKAIPLGKLGFDLVVQAKSGTGKTCVFAVLALETIAPDNAAPQVLVVAPTREIANQIFATVRSIGSAMKSSGLIAGLCIGGTNYIKDVGLVRNRCPVVIGTPGRLCQLVRDRALDLGAIRLFVLDEADKLMEESYRDHINYLFSQLPQSKQVGVFSATYPNALDVFLSDYMRSPTMVRLDSADVQLIGIKQYYVCVARKTDPGSGSVIALKCQKLLELLRQVNYSQCLVFCNYQDKCAEAVTLLNEAGLEPLLMTGTLSQIQRFEIMKKLKLFKTRLVVSTDLTARGIDASKVDLVVNLEIPHDSETYFHRIGRAGRFGARGAAVTFGMELADDRRFRIMGLMSEFRVKQVREIEQLPLDLCSNYTFWESLPDINFRKNGRHFVKQTTENAESEKNSENGAVFYGKPSPNRDTEIRLQRNRNMRRNIISSLSSFPRPDPNRISPELYVEKFCCSQAVSAEGVPENAFTGNVLRKCYTRETMLSLCPLDLRPAANVHGLPENGVSLTAATTTGTENSYSGHNKPPIVRHSRCEMLSIRDGLPLAFITCHPFGFSESVAATKLTDFNLDVKKLKKIMIAGSLRKDVVASGKSFEEDRDIQNGDISQKPRMPKFIPSRLKNKKKYYMRGELLEVRDSLEAKTWLEYAEQKWQLQTEPFVSGFKPSPQKEEMFEGKNTENDTIEENVLGQSLKILSICSFVQNRYSRGEMMSVLRSVGPRQWQQYAQSKWDFSSDPFCQDLEMRGSFRQQLIVSREHEKQKRRVALEERQREAARKFAMRLIPFSDQLSPLHRDLSERYDDQLLAEFDIFKRNLAAEDEISRRQGPVVLRRRQPADWTKTVCLADQILDILQRQFQSLVMQPAVEKSSTPLLDEQVEPELVEVPVVQINSEDFVVSQGSPQQRNFEDYLKIPKISPDKTSNPFRYRTVRYDMNSMLAIWENVVQLGIDPQSLPWHTTLRDLGLYVFREFVLNGGSSEDGSIGQIDGTNLVKSFGGSDLSLTAENTPVNLGKGAEAAKKIEQVAVAIQTEAENAHVFERTTVDSGSGRPEMITDGEVVTEAEIPDEHPVLGEAAKLAAHYGELTDYFTVDFDSTNKLRRYYANLSDGMRRQALSNTGMYVTMSNYLKAMANRSTDSQI